MWNYIKRYLHFGILAACFMICEVMMDLLQPEIMSRIVDDGVLGLGTGGNGDMMLIWKFGIEMMVIALIGGASGSLSGTFAQLIGQNTGNDIRKDCFGKVMAFSFSQTDKFGTGSLITRVTNDITNIQNYVAMFVRSVVRMTMLTCGSIWFIFRMNRQFGLIVLCAVPFIVGCLAFCLVKGNPLFMKLQEHLDRINAILQEDVSGIRIIKACVREVYEKIRFGKANDELIKTQLQVLIVFSFMNPVINALMYLVVAGILLAGSYQHAAGAVTPGEIMAAITYTTRLLNGILMLVMISQNISRGTASWKRLKEVLVCEPELKDGTYEGSKNTKETGDMPEAANSGSVSGSEIEFRDVSFAYPGSSQTVLSHINLKIHAGETIAVMGATGCGKSTLIHLIPRFYDVTEGAVLVDGVDVREYKQKALRKKIAIAMQKSELFSESVAENISWGIDTSKNSQAEKEYSSQDAQKEISSQESKSSEEKLTDKKIQLAAHIAQAHSFVSEMPNGYDSMVAERGRSLSGGQKQRLSIARAVAKNAPILIFDDATSALDLKTEANLYEALKEAHPGCTKLIVAQRVASVKGADRIVVLEKGKIASIGTHVELLASCAIYRDIYYSQMGEEREMDGTAE